MAIQQGSLVLLKIKDEQINKFITIGGLRTTRFSLNNHVVDATSKDSGSWRQILSEAGISNLTITAAGIFTDSNAERLIQLYAFDNIIQEYELHFGNGDKIIGCFLISNYERSGNYNEEELYNITLDSSGRIAYLLNPNALHKVKVT